MSVGSNCRSQWVNYWVSVQSLALFAYTAVVTVVYERVTPWWLLWCTSKMVDTPCLKTTVHICFSQNFVKFTPILIIFDRKMAKRLKLCKIHSFSTSPNSRHHTTVLNADDEWVQVDQSMVDAAISQWHRLSTCVRVRGEHFEHNFW